MSSGGWVSTLSDRETGARTLSHLLGAVDAPTGSGAAGHGGGEPDGLVVEVDPIDVRPSVVDRAISQHGYVVVRGLLDTDTARRLARLSTQAAHGRDIFGHDRTVPDPEHFTPLPATAPIVEGVGLARWFIRTCEATMAVESPASMQAVMASLAATGIADQIRPLLSGEPLLAAEKLLVHHVPAVLPPKPLPHSLYPGWHRDGGAWPSVRRAIGLWVALDDCGGDTGARGLSTLPGLRPDEEPGSLMSVEFHQWLERSGREVRQTLCAGDAVIFDNHLLHRTQGGSTGFDRPRRSIQCWWFGADDFPDRLTPVGFVPLPDASG